MTASEGIVDVSQYTDHQLVRNQLTVIDKPLSCLAQLGTLLDLIAQHIARRDMSQAVVLYQQVALCSLT